MLHPVLCVVSSLQVYKLWVLSHESGDESIPVLKLIIVVAEVVVIIIIDDIRVTLQTSLRRSEKA